MESDKVLLRGRFGANRGPAAFATGSHIEGLIQLQCKGTAISDLMLLSQAQMRRITPYFPLSRGIPRVDDRKIISGIIFVIRNGLRWRDAPKEYGPHKKIYNRFIRRSRLGVFSRILAELTARCGQPEQLMIDATHLKAHRTAASLLKKGMLPDVSGEPKVV